MELIGNPYHSLKIEKEERELEKNKTISREQEGHLLHGNPSHSHSHSHSLKRENEERELEKLKTIVREQEGRLQNLQSTAFQLANYYFVFQGVILTAICNGSSSLKCSDRWFLFTLSLFAATLNLVALSIIGLKYLRTIAQQDQNWTDCNKLQSKLLTEAFPDAEELKTTQVDGDRYKEHKRSVSFATCMILFIGFASVTLSGCWHILCKHDERKSLLENDKCIKLCDGGGRCVKICSEYY